jgi:hypothetical protein
MFVSGPASAIDTTTPRLSSPKPKKTWSISVLLQGADHVRRRVGGDDGRRVGEPGDRAVRAPLLDILLDRVAEALDDRDVVDGHLEHVRLGVGVGAG